ncbi:MAG: cell wall hydrolase [Desulfurellales bacterium]|nr:MAG: cell wall hydrolase [Desulfurellales bacterium]
MKAINTILLPGDIDYGWRTIRMEAANQGDLGMLGVAYVLRNRLEWRRNDRWATLAQVCLDWLQFSEWREADATFLPTLAYVLDATGLRCLNALVTALSGTQPDPTQGARHYFNPKHANPAWARGKAPCVVISDHHFFNNVA